MSAWVAAGQSADAALRVADAALLACTGVIAQQPLFDLYFLHGAEAQRAGSNEATAWFAAAAAVAWTQDPKLPVDDWRLVDGWKAGQHAARHARRAKLTLDAPPEGATWAIDGVDLGPGARSIEVFPGPYRITATIPGRARTFVQLLSVVAGESRTLATAFPPEVDLATVHGAVVAAMIGTPLDPGTRAALDAWAAQRGLAELVVVWIKGNPRRLCTLELADYADYDCNTLVDDHTALFDDDGDGFTEAEGDCDDARAIAFPGATETIDGRDEDCDTLVDDETTAYDDDGDGYTEDLGDCDDNNAYAWPGAPEKLDGWDSDCDGEAERPEGWFAGCAGAPAAPWLGVPVALLAARRRPRHRH
ncbi:MAG: hypothetical protein FJZ01_28355 [Candidatus Sericytochromatia bacterium]|nr:hypothetical protein [Candidatus Tanganyikabacteria bacterium]MBM4390758.1 hypothetical protein [Deltaproteobacteria bacterium]